MAEGAGWYEVVPGSDGLQQGDVLWSCPIIVPAPELTFPLPSDAIPAVIKRFDVIIATQSCDIENDKVEEVIVCAHWDLDEARSMDPALSKSGVDDNISKGR